MVQLHVCATPTKRLNEILLTSFDQTNVLVSLTEWVIQSFINGPWRADRYRVKWGMFFVTLSH